MRRNLIIGIIACVLIFVFSGNGWSYHAPPLDTGHDLTNTKPPKPPEPPEPPDDDPCKDKDKPATESKGSPVHVASGDLILTFVDAIIPGPGPSMDIVRSINSQEHYNGPFGYAWVSEHTTQLVQFTDGINDYVIIRLSDGKRARFIKNPDGTYTAEEVLTYDRLQDNGDGTFTLNANCASCARSSQPEIQFNADGFPEYIADLKGNRLTFSYDNDGFLATVTNAAGKSLIYAYGSNRKISSITLPNSEVYRYGYDDNDNLVSVTDPAGNTTTYIYNDEQRLVSIIDPTGRTIFQVTYDSLARVATYTEGAETYTYAYDPGNKRTTKTDSNNKSTTYYYNDDDLVWKVVYPDGSSTEYVFDENNNPTRMTDANGKEWNYTYDENGNLISKTDPLGNTWTYTYNEFNQRTSEADPLGYTETYAYDAIGNMISRKDKAGNQWTYTYNAKSQQTSKIDPLGRTTVYEYDSDGNLVKVTDPLGNETRFTYDQLGRKRSQTDARGNISYYSYDSAGFLTLIRNALGNDTRYQYDAAGNLISETDALGNTTTYQYDSNNQLIKKTDVLGNATTYAYNAQGEKISETDPLGNTKSWSYNARGWLISETDAIGNTTTYTYDNLGNVTSVKDARENTISYIYNAAGRRTKAVDPLGNERQFVHDAVGRVVSIIDAKGKTLTRTYDPVGRVVSITDRVGTVTNIEYDADGNALTRTVCGQGESYTVTVTYDALNRRISVTNPNGDTTSYVYDENGNRTQVIGPDSSTFSYVYNPLNRPIRLYDSIGTIEELTYDAIGKLLTRKDSAGNTTSYTYDSVNRRVAVTYPNGSSISAAYDEAGRMLSMTNRGGTTIQFSRDALGRVVSLNDGTRTGSVVYDEMGNRTSITDYKGQTISFEYDALNRNTQVTHADTSTSAFAYDANGNLIQETKPSGATLQYAYGQNNRLTQITMPDGEVISFARNYRGLIAAAANKDYTVTYSYDVNARVIQEDQPGGSVHYSYDAANGRRTITYPGSRTVTEQYDSRRRLTTLTDENGIHLLDNSFDTTSQRLTGMTYGNGIIAQYSYDTEGLSRLIYKKGSAELIDYGYTRDASGKVTEEKNNLKSDQTKNYTYDTLGRLIQVTLGESDPDITSFSLDPNGNWLSKTVDGAATPYTVNVLNQYLSEGGTALGYDSNGNLNDDGDFTYTYDAINRLVSIAEKASGNEVATYTYDALGRRITKTVGGTTTRYVYSQTRQVLEEHETGTLIRSYIYNSVLPNQALGMRIHQGGNYQDYYFLKDRMGSVIAVADQNGTIVEEYSYTPYGRVLDAAGNPMGESTVGNSFFFVGQVRDMESGNYYFHARYYSARFGRFLSRDPLGYKRGGFNLYEYANSNPLAFVDPLGLEAAKCEEVGSLEFDLSKQFGEILNKIKFLAKIELGSESSIKFLAERCNGRCCVKKTGTWKEGTWYRFTASGSASISYEQLIPGAGFEIPGTDIGGGIYAKIGIVMTARGKLDKAWNKDCQLVAYGQACLSLDKGYVQLSLQLRAAIVEAGMYGELFVSASICATTTGVLSGEFCLGGKVWVEGKIDLWLTEIEKSFDFWEDKICTQVSKKII
ncbi:MAG: hypothetical protein KAV83_09410 [Desulfobacterales bacterium]|nr:hypothetical protein [Desulfobacterales bacterium]